MLDRPRQDKDRPGQETKSRSKISPKSSEGRGEVLEKNQRADRGLAAWSYHSKRRYLLIQHPNSTDRGTMPHASKITKTTHKPVFNCDPSLPEPLPSTHLGHCQPFTHCHPKKEIPYREDIFPRPPPSAKFSSSRAGCSSKFALAHLA